MLDKIQSFFGFTRTPFRRDLAHSMLHRHAGHAEAVARIRWCINENALGVITGEVGAGKTVALRAALAELGEVLEYEPLRATIKVPWNDVPAQAGRLLAAFAVVNALVAVAVCPVALVARAVTV